MFCGRWVKEIWGCDIKISAAVADGSMQFHDGMIYSVKASTDPELKFELSDEPFCNDDGSEIGWATDWPHLKRKVLNHSITQSLNHSITAVPVFTAWLDVA